MKEKNGIYIDYFLYKRKEYNNGGGYMEGKNKFNKLGKIKTLLKKEAFYVVLFLCLCIIGSAIAISSKMAKNKEEQQLAKKVETNEINVNENKSRSMENAEQVKNDADDKKTTEKKTKAVSNTNQSIEFQNPLKGDIVRKYNGNVVRTDSETHRNIDGIDIKAKVGTEVKASAEGVVDEVGTSADMGSYVVIKHTNEYKSIYGNLDKNISVKKGGKVKVGDLIGKTGSTCTIAPMNQEGSYLRFVIRDSKNNNINPLTYKSITLK